MSEFKVLIVEDEVLVAEDLADLLDEAGYTVTGLAYNSRMALEELSTNTPDVVL